MYRPHSLDKVFLLVVGLFLAVGQGIVVCGPGVDDVAFDVLWCEGRKEPEFVERSTDC